MKQHPDALFREKLEQHTLIAPQNAWSRIEMKMPATRNTFFLWKVAAAILIIIVSIALLIPDKPSNQPLALSDTTPAQKQKIEKMEASVIPSTPKKKEDVRRTVIRKEQPGLIETPTISVEPTPRVESIEIIAEEKTESIASLEVSEQPAVLTEEESVAPLAQPAVSDEATTIVLTAAEVNTKYLLPSPAQATSEAETTSSFRKLIDKAASFKNNTSGLAELRQKKNEMLALNTEKLRNRNEKNERNN